MIQNAVDHPHEPQTPLLRRTQQTCFLVSVVDTVGPIYLKPKSDWIRSCMNQVLAAQKPRHGGGTVTATWRERHVRRDCQTLSRFAHRVVCVSELAGPCHLATGQICDWHGQGIARDVERGRVRGRYTAWRQCSVAGTGVRWRRWWWVFSGVPRLRWRTCINGSDAEAPFGNVHASPWLTIDVTQHTQKSIESAAECLKCPSAAARPAAAAVNQETRM